MKKKIIVIAEIILVSFILFQGWKIFSLKQAEWKYLENQKAIQAEIQEVENQKPKSVQPSNEISNEEIARQEIEEGKNRVLKLKEKYPQVVAIIEIPGTKMMYPILQGKDNAFYLDHDIAGKYNPFGEVFMDYRNAKSLGDENTIVYGHNVRTTGAIFNELLNYKDKSYFEQHQKIHLFFEGRKKEYRVFSAYITEPQTPYRIVNYDQKDEFQAFLQEAIGRSLVKPIKNQGIKRILTLSTCSDKNHRMVIHAAEVE